MHIVAITKVEFIAFIIKYEKFNLEPCDFFLQFIINKKFIFLIQIL